MFYRNCLQLISISQYRLKFCYAINFFQSNGCMVEILVVDRLNTLSKLKYDGEIVSMETQIGDGTFFTVCIFWTFSFQKSFESFGNIFGASHLLACWRINLNGVRRIMFTKKVANRYRLYRLHHTCLKCVFPYFS